MKKNLLKAMALMAALFMGNATTWAAEEAQAVVKMTYINNDDPDTAYGAIADGESAITGFNVLSNGTVGWANAGWGVNYITYLQVDASAIEGSITKATLKIEASGSRDSKRTQCVAVGYNDSEWSAELTANTCDRTNVKQLDGDKWTSSKSATVFNELSFDITDALKDDADKVVTILVFTNNKQYSAGGCNVKNPTVTVEYVAAGTEMADYTVKYVCNETEVKEPAVRNGVVGETVELTADDVADFINAEGTAKYIYVEDNASTTTIASEGTVVTVTFREAGNYSYAVVSNLSTTIAEGQSFEKESVSVPYPKYIVDEGTLYTRAAGISNKNQFNYVFTLNSDNQTETIDYSVATRDDVEVTDVVFFSEAEDIEGMTPETGGNANIRCSMSKGAYNAGEEPVYVTSLAPGTYKVELQVWGNAGQTITVACGDFSVDLATVGYITSVVSEEFNLTADTEVTITGGAAGGKCADYVLITGTGKVATAISEVNAAARQAGTVYNLAGQQVKSAQKGLYIIDGKKVVK